MHPRVDAAVRALREEARRTNERRLLVLAGSHDACLDALPDVFEAGDVADPVLVGHRDPGTASVERHEPRRADALLGTTRECVVVDGHEECRPNALGRAVGAVDGGGLLVLLAPPLDEWSRRRDRFDETLAAPPATVEDVSGRFRQRLVSLLRAHRGVAIVDVDSEVVEREGLTDPAPARPQASPTLPETHAFPRVAYEACRTADQIAALRAFERLRDPSTAVVLEADRGRGKSSAAGLAAGSLAAAGRDVLVTAPDRRGAGELFARAREVLDALGVLADRGDEVGEGNGELRAAEGGRVRFVPPLEASEFPDDPDVVLVDEAAGLPVSLLSSLLGRVPVGFATTVHGYEGAGRGFAVRFRERLAESDCEVVDVSMAEPIRYAGTDPVEPWAFRALLLDASPAVELLVADATPDSVEYARPTPDDLLADEHLLRELFGLLVLAHYRTEPDDLARLLDAPNLSARCLVHGGHVVSVALLAREGGFDADTCERIYREGRVQGNMLPDLMTGQLRDPDVGRPLGVRVVRIATHPSVQSSGLGTELLDSIHREFGDEVDWFGTSYGATPRLLDFWRANGYHSVHLSATRNATSGEHSVAMLRPAAPAPAPDHVTARHARWFRQRVGDVLGDTLSEVDADVVRGTLAAFDSPVVTDLSDREWRLIASAAFGPGQFDMHPGPFRRLALRTLTDPAFDLDPRQERLLVRRVLQFHDWESVADELDFYSKSGARRELGQTFAALVAGYGTKAARDERDRYG
ncbi:tRNA(Met) cytidine acetyltransferase TmcA [Halomarina litorea]|uniref:tRNA(Met) cytidine acetyltransferase TmcA n=1 Tax=Halomarina litorea TaxID=2961595 RepID=UPI0020C37590|nr:tRNA(Met) cytidine acetyltransferase TmcA [Halomarina sp. BCD28]